MVRFDPCIHLPATGEDRCQLENALWEGWELMVDEDTGEVWIGDKEEGIAQTRRMADEWIGNEEIASGKAV